MTRAPTRRIDAQSPAEARRRSTSRRRRSTPRRSRRSTSAAPGAGASSTSARARATSRRSAPRPRPRPAASCRRTSAVERHAELVDWARTRTTTDPAARIRAELVAFSSSSLADHLADIAPYAAARGASSLAELAALPADTLDDMIASAGWSILKAATFRRHLARYHDEHAGRTWLPPRAPDVFYDVGDVFDVVEALRDAHSPLRGRFDRVYVGAGVDRSSCRVLLRLLAPDGLLVAPRDDRHGEAQRLVTARFPRHKTSICVRALRSSTHATMSAQAVRRGAGDAYAITAGARVARLARASERRRRRVARAGAGRARLGRGAARRLSAGVPGRRRDARARRRAGRRRRGERAVARVAREDPPVRPGALVRARARRRRRPARVRSVRPAGAREVLLRRSRVLFPGLPARGVRRSCCCLHGAARRRQRRRRRVGRRGRARRALEAAPGCRSRGRGGRRGRGGGTGTGR